MKKLISICASVLIFLGVEAQDITDSVKCKYYMNTEDALQDKNGIEAYFDIKHKERGTVKMNGGSEYKFFQEDLPNKMINKEIAVIQCKDSVYLNLKKMDREFGYALLRKKDTFQYIHSYLEASQRASTNGMFFGVIGAASTKYYETFLLLDRQYRVYAELEIKDMKRRLDQLVDTTHYNAFQNEQDWTIDIALKYYPILHPINP